MTLPKILKILQLAITALLSQEPQNIPFTKEVEKRAKSALEQRFGQPGCFVVDGV